MSVQEEQKSNLDMSFVIISKEFLGCMRYLSPQCCGVWNILLVHWWYKKGSTTERRREYVYPSLKKMERALGITHKTIQKCITELTILGFIKKVEKKYSDKNSANLSSYYYLDDKPTVTPKKLVELSEFRNVRRARKVSPDDLIEVAIFEGDDE
jgi:hypothetical protein